MPSLRGVARRCTHTNTTLLWDVRFCVATRASKMRTKYTEVCGNDGRPALRCSIPARILFESRAPAVIERFNKISRLPAINTGGIINSKRGVTDHGASLEHAHGDVNVSPRLWRCQMNPPNFFLPDPQQNLVQHKFASKIEHTFTVGLQGRADVQLVRQHRAT